MSARQAPEAAPRGRSTLVWDLPVRLFHWSLVILVVTSWITAEMGGNALEWHRRSGYTILTLILFRLSWGVFGSEHARFVSFLRGPKVVLGYARSLLGNNWHRHRGHNPLGGWAVVALLLCLLTQAVLGLFANDDVMLEGPLVKLITKELSDRLTTLHKINFNILLGLVALHLAANMFYAFVKRDNLVKPMLTGHKPLTTAEAGTSARVPSHWLALALLLLSAAAVYAVVNYL